MSDEKYSFSLFSLEEAFQVSSFKQLSTSMNSIEWENEWKWDNQFASIANINEKMNF